MAMREVGAGRVRARARATRRRQLLGGCPAGLETHHILKVAVERLDQRVDELEDGKLILWLGEL